MQFSQLLVHILILVAMVFSSLANAAVRADKISNAVMIFIGEQMTRQNTLVTGRIEVSVDTIDPRLAFSDCNKPLKVESNADDWIGRVHVKVSCPGPTPWAIYVPATIKLYQDIVILSRNLSRGQPVTKDDVRLEERDVSSLRRQYYQKVDDVLGMAGKRHLSANAVLSPEMLVPPLLVKKGDIVTIHAKAGAAEITTQGTALSDGQEGDSITVLNNASQRKIQANVIGPQAVGIGY
ncbi:flagellar basal body P-ring formation chaperone FlgA [Pokkaliibacter sp. MBI-7]|uniref:flagellar basal body P-ring formation chaperone FlgA n=1 Tax=Pokkaliibacter sp. MBI-7 TaxID=3040600 RepID=UPI0024496ABC|nr:flagellar basal body P-ring formation chaperone FlgA [Pokkaliibacter sp. MBI-7]MDH2431331.1 flagellar basal body P-ring formation chaperone FlgA [Pokkaliibacter sp. MBI-7]